MYSEMEPPEQKLVHCLQVNTQQVRAVESVTDICLTIDNLRS